MDKYRFKKKDRRNPFTDRVVNDWDRLSRQTVTANIRESFKRRLDRFVDEDDMVSGKQKVPSVN